MANIGEVAEAINASKVHLDIGGNRLILLQEIEQSFNHPEAREATDAGSVYFYGQSDDSFTATLLLSTPEINTFHGYTILNSDGDLPSKEFHLIYADKTGANTKTVKMNCKVPEVTFSKPVEGGVKCRMRFRVTGGAETDGTIVAATDITG